MRRVGRPPIGARARRLIAIRLDPEVLKRFRTEARRRNVGYQTLIHRVLAEYIRKTRRLTHYRRRKPRDGKHLTDLSP